MKWLELDIKRTQVEIAELIEDQEDMKPRRSPGLSRTQWERARRLRKVRLAPHIEKGRTD